jgi:hypothetical protein
MVIRDEVREAQRALAALDAARVRAVDRLDRAVARRTEVVAEADRQVAAARSGLEAAIVEMARQVGVDLAATLAGVEAAEVRRLSKTSPSATASKGGGR